MTARWRTAKPSDDKAIVDRFVALNREDPGPETVSREQAMRTLATFRREPQRGVAIVLDVDDTTCGYALLVSFWSNELGGEVCTVDELYVDPSQRRHGHARMLFEQLDQLWARAHVAHAIETTPANARAREFYESLGFTGSNLAMIKCVVPRQGPTEGLLR